MPLFAARSRHVDCHGNGRTECDRAYGKAGLAAAAHSREEPRVLDSVLLTTLAIGPGWSTMNGSQKFIGPFPRFSLDRCFPKQLNPIGVDDDRGILIAY
jgi:hypothetical protein